MNKDIMQEIALLELFDLNSAQQGLKIHHEADGAKVEAAARLHQKGLISQEDGGYLTDRGLEAAEHAERLLGLLKPV